VHVNLIIVYVMRKSCVNVNHIHLHENNVNICQNTLTWCHVNVYNVPTCNSF
jgi:hypothetical protein